MPCKPLPSMIKEQSVPEFTWIGRMTLCADACLLVVVSDGVS